MIGTVRCMPKFRSKIVALAVALLLALPQCTFAAEWEFGGDFRFFGFYALEDLGELRRDAELLALRLKAEVLFSETLSFEAHALLEARSPAIATGVANASGGTRRLFDLETTVLSSEDVAASTSFDRFFLTWEQPNFRMTAGRQAITWGVNYFWPALDLFAPFAPERIDRDYKAGVDAVRVTIPTGSFSEWDVVMAQQGSEFDDDFSAAALRRWDVKNSDVGLMGGYFHSDWVAGGFFVTELWGNGIRGELSYTDSGDERDAEIDRASFWRASVGIDKQLNPDLNLIIELAWNGFGSSDPSDYLRILQSDRVMRGEVNAVGRLYSGLSLSWQVHPLLTVGGAALLNVDDGSVLLQPTGTWSISDNGVVQFGLIVGLGRGVSETGDLGSEYGAAPTTVWGAFKVYF